MTLRTLGDGDLRAAIERQCVVLQFLATLATGDAANAHSALFTFVDDH